ncbi:hypothetical protein PFISCL1PPCAC_1969, partial [Pristionchus fissidentatus]
SNCLSISNGTMVSHSINLFYSQFGQSLLRFFNHFFMDRSLSLSFYHSSEVNSSLFLVSLSEISLGEDEIVLDSRLDRIHCEKILEGIVVGARGKGTDQFACQSLLDEGKGSHLVRETTAHVQTHHVGLRQQLDGGVEILLEECSNLHLFEGRSGRFRDRTSDNRSCFGSIGGERRRRERRLSQNKGFSAQKSPLLIVLNGIGLEEHCLGESPFDLPRLLHLCELFECLIRSILQKKSVHVVHVDGLKGSRRRGWLVGRIEVENE